ncbi:hypothetical protein SAMN05660479_03026, partial [Microbulbifer thermotolerans]
MGTQVEIYKKEAFSHKLGRVFKILCQPNSHRLMYFSKRSGKWIASCDSV